MKTESAKTITEQEVLEAQKDWGEGIVKIGKVFLENGDYKAEAEKHISTFYAYDSETVFFKPTMTALHQFRTTRDGALSYFIGQNPDFPEDHGFALKSWHAVRWEGLGIKIVGSIAIAMGNYYFTPAKGGQDLKIEYTFAYTKNKKGQIQIIMHGSHLPFSPITNK